MKPDKILAKAVAELNDANFHLTHAIAYFEDYLEQKGIEIPYKLKLPKSKLKKKK